MHRKHKKSANTLTAPEDTRKAKKRIIILKSKKMEKPDISLVSLKKVKPELAKHAHNAAVLMHCSNATPIRCKVGMNYVCCFCQQSFRDPAQLKTHSIDFHDHSSRIKHLNSQFMCKYMVKLDISRLCCVLCDTNMPNLDTLVDHLLTIHGKKYNTDIKSHILPFKFAGESVICGVCDSDFSSFKNLLEHMNDHFKNFVCEICGSGFVNKKAMLAHSYRHRVGDGEFFCDFCPKVFDTRIKKQDHQRAMHVEKKRYKCGYCGEKFSDHRKKMNHEVKVHGAQPVMLTCQGCQKTFNDRRNLTTHTKKYH